eukprot:GFUD01017250.1.p1 GENE.GFUD01017250.1~~GFUD01017250.1.p1  ORF type:complete len:1654 (+),score=467.45 GFUD01017250.1:121-5082(+)
MPKTSRGRGRGSGRRGGSRGGSGRGNSARGRGGDSSRGRGRSSSRGGGGGAGRGRSSSRGRGGMDRKDDRSFFDSRGNRGRGGPGRVIEIHRNEFAPGVQKNRPATGQDVKHESETLPSCVSNETKACEVETLDKVGVTLLAKKKMKKRSKSKPTTDCSQTSLQSDQVTSVQEPTTSTPAKLTSNLSTPLTHPKCASPSPAIHASKIHVLSESAVASQDVRLKQKSLSTQVAPSKLTKLTNTRPTSVEAAVQVLPVLSSPKKSPMMSNCISRSTGLKILSVTSSIQGYVFTANDRAKLVRSIPGVVIINTAMKGDCLVLGVDIEEHLLSSVLTQMEEQKSWTISCVDTTYRDTYSYLTGWNFIPRVDKSGLFQLIVSFKGQGWRSRDVEMKKRNQLLELVKDFNIVKIVHGEGETILLVGHVLECVAYSDCLRNLFSLERRHTWQPKPVSNSELSQTIPDQERHFWLKVKCPELSNLSTAHKQYSVFHQLSTAGKVLQLEHQLFGAEDNYLVVYSGLGDSKPPALGQQFCLMEMWPDSLPDFYTPTYGVDSWGFYSVSGKFPESRGDETRNKFAEDMKIIGAVGFRSGESEESFSLHFVNSRCLEQISRCAQYNNFRLTILSSLVRKASLDRKLRKLVPAILKLKELKLAQKLNSKEMVKVNVENEEYNSCDKIDEKKIEDLVIPRVSQIKSKNEEFEEKPPMQNKTKQICPQEKSQQKLPVIKQVSVKKAGLTNVDTKESGSAQVSESELLRICWKEKGSLSGYLKNLCKFFGLVQDVVVTESGDSKDILFKFPSKKKLEEVLQTLCSEETNSSEKLKKASPKVKLQSSKLFKNKYGLVLTGKSATISRLKKDFAKFGEVEIEVRSHVFVLWFESKLSLFKALTDRRTHGHIMVPAANNFEFCKITKPVETDEHLVVNEDTIVRNVIEEVPVAVGNAGKTNKDYKLTEKEIFGFIWQSQKEKLCIRDDQVISRQLTNFIKNVSCKDLTVDEDGLVVSFSSEADVAAALSKFSSTPVAMLPSMCRKFTLLPSRGFFGLFSVKRVKPEHFSRFGDCKVRNCGIWFADKLSMFSVLRDPFISKTYPALFIDCRNIYILSSNKLLPVQPEKQDKPVASSALKTCMSNSQPQGVMTRSAMAKLSAQVSMAGLSSMEEVLHNSKLKNAVDTANYKLPSSEPADPAIVAAVSSPAPVCQPAITCPLLATLLSADRSANKDSLRLQKTGLGQGKFGYKLGMIGHIPSARLVRTGYKQSWMPLNTRTVAEADLFLEDKDCYRDKDVKEAANLISNILQGKMSEVTGATLKEIKMKRVEHFLKDKLGVDCRLTKEGIEKLEAGEMMVNEKYGMEDDATKLEEVQEKLSSKMILCKNMAYENDEDVSNKCSSFKLDDRKTRLLKLEARQKFEKEALIYPDQLIVGSKIAPIVMENLEISGENSPDSVPDSKKDCDETDLTGSIEENAPIAIEEVLVQTSPEPTPATDKASHDLHLTPDLIGLYTLTLPVPPGSDLTLLSSLQEDIAWFDTPVSILCMDNMTDGGAVLEVKLRDKDMTIAVLNGLRKKYPGLEGDSSSNHADIFPDKETGLYTLCFTDTNRKRYKATMEKFKMYSKQLPIISRGLGEEQVLVAFHAKEEAVKALRQNLDNDEFPELHVASVSRS